MRRLIVIFQLSIVLAAAMAMGCANRMEEVAKAFNGYLRETTFTDSSLNLGDMGDDVEYSCGGDDYTFENASIVVTAALSSSTMYIASLAFDGEIKGGGLYSPEVECEFSNLQISTDGVSAVASDGYLEEASSPSATCTIGKQEYETDEVLEAFEKVADENKCD